MKRKVSMILAVVLCLALFIPTYALAEAELVGDNIDYSLFDSVYTGEYDDKIAYRLNNRPKTRGDAIREMESEGWILTALYVDEDQSDQLNDLPISPFSSITHSRVVNSTFTYTPKTEIKYNNVLLRGITNFDNAIMTVLGNLKFSWVPSLFGINTHTLASFIYSGTTVFTSAETLFTRNIEIKVSDWSQWLIYAESERYAQAATQVMSGHFQDGKPYSISKNGYGESKSPLYDSPSGLLLKAQQGWANGAPYIEYASPVSIVYIN